MLSTGTTELLILLAVIVVIALWISFAVFVIRLGGERQIGSRLTAVIVYFFSPFIGLLVVALSSGKKNESIDYYGELLRLNELHGKGGVTDKELEIEKRRLQFKRDTQKEIEPDNAGVKYYLIATLIPITILIAINGTALLLLFNENKAKQEKVKQESDKAINEVYEPSITAQHMGLTLKSNERNTGSWGFNSGVPLCFCGL